MIKIALLGLGTIGLSTYKLIHEKLPNIEIRYVLDKDISKKFIVGDILTSNYEDIINDPEITVVIEMLGGLDFAYKCVKQALLSRKNVITSNKEVVAAKMVELLDIAKQNNVYFLFEASVGGGIPIINYLALNQKINDIVSISGIINGTTNYILTRMAKDKLSFNDALAMAQKLGFAEANPQADIEGYDLMRKIAILAMLGYQTEINPNQIYRYKMTNVPTTFLEYATKLNKTLKYLAVATLQGNIVNIRVEPVAVSNDTLFAHIENENNLICVDGQIGHKQMFYGLGAGGMPTAMAVVEDLIIVLESRGKLAFEPRNKYRLSHIDIPSSHYLIMTKEEHLYVSELISAVELDNMLDQIVFYARIEGE